MKASNAVSQPERERQKKELEEELSQDKENLQLIQQAIAKVQSEVVQEKDLPFATREIVDIAASSQIELASVKPLSMQVKDEYELLPIEIRFQCGFTDLIKFLSKVEASSTLVAVQNLSINRDEVLFPKLDIRLTVCALFSSEQR
ncbi:MAG: type 4a pilus biogenesis protein PilO [Candidatus Omnitrophica bacterium]|nr:type 4a pilus biogenesis protein PilO [Candidatus Omnitrophota bacterium]